MERWVVPALATAVLLVTGCTGRVADAAAGGDGLRFVLRAPDAGADTVYVQRDAEDRPAAWLSLYRDDERVTFWERCEVPDCGAPAEAVCGARLPEVLALVPGEAGADSVSLVWGGRVSRTTEAACEVREPAEPGNWTARFCWGSGYRPMPNAPPMATHRVGHVTEPTCVEQPFNLAGDTLVEGSVPRTH